MDRRHSEQYDRIGTYVDRVHSAIIKYKDLPCVAITRKEDYLMKLLPIYPADSLVKEQLPAGDKLIHVDDPDISLGAASIGFFNHKDTKQCYMPVRRPDRQWNVGIQPVHLSFECLDDRAIPKNIIWCRGFEDMLRGLYPTVHEALDLVRKDWSCVAISKAFMFKKNSLDIPVLCFRDWEPVCWLSPNGKVHLVESNPLLRHMNKCGNRLNRYIQEMENYAA